MSLRPLVCGLFLSCSLLSGCTTTPEATAKRPSQSQMGNLLLAEPAPVDPRAQMAIARYSFILQQQDLNAEDKAELHYQRGLLYDSVGLTGLASFDFNQALELKPDMAAVYNSLGVHYIQRSEFEQAYEAFDSTLEIDPEYDFALLNRGIALYYGGRAALAVNDLASFIEKDPSDPFRIIWAYIALQELDPIQAQQKLAIYRQALDPQHWANGLVSLFLGEMTENEVLISLVDGITSQQQLTYRLCEAYFYLGKYHQALGNFGKALSYFKLALSTNVFEYVEHRYARLELARVREARKVQNQ
ncbi:lipoprotein NlpI [Alteromonas sediminis]|uniref:Lipoprotein NlpI n=1 Tax=Alteromonas sediminis TaxID=2259342 RepID=A0A3N5YDH6_9ALTE|nr:lipoprotein NlpI [Alteromonas sediminis]RPJ67615.1 lipoprotein NlpI [Alteromonas sediminis]